MSDCAWGPDEVRARGEGWVCVMVIRMAAIVPEHIHGHLKVAQPLRISICVGTGRADC